MQRVSSICTVNTVVRRSGRTPLGLLQMSCACFAFEDFPTVLGLVWCWLSL